MITDTNTSEWQRRKKSFLLFTMTVALLVAIPCELVATALYSAVSLTAHLQNNEYIIISCSQTGTLRVTGVKLGSDFTFLDLPPQQVEASVMEKYVRNVSILEVLKD